MFFIETPGREPMFRLRTGAILGELSRKSCFTDWQVRPLRIITEQNRRSSRVGRDHGMRIATITNWAYGATVCLTIAAGIAMVLASNADRVEREAVIQRDRFDALAFEVESDEAQLTDQARLFAVTGNPSHEIVYNHALAALGPVEQRVARLKDNGAKEEELRSLAEGLRWAETLQDEQKAAIAAMKTGDDATARRIVFGAEYERELERVHFLLGRFRYMLDQRSDRTIEDASMASQRLRTVSEVMVGVTALLFLFVLGFVLKRRILKPVTTLSDVVNRLADQDYAVEPPQLSQIDEIGDMAHAIRIFRENGIERQRLERERDADWHVRDLLSRMTQRLQGCESVADLFEVVRLFAPKIAPNLAGRLYTLDDRLGMMACASEWQSPHGSDAAFTPDDCWALRRGQAHMPGGDIVDVPCKHVTPDAASATVCVPLTAQGETIGLLVLENLAETHGPGENIQAYIELMSETVGLALANLKLRDALHEKALFDALTGLRNRHELADTLRRHVAQADAARTQLSCLMVDIDHFKLLNDRYGHDAGDLTIRSVAGVLDNAVREEGVAFRYGGEEFLLLLPGFDEERALERARLIQERIAGMTLVHDGASLGRVTVSMGLATYPAHVPAHALIAKADAALLRAKEEGRDRVVAAVDRRDPGQAVPAG
ncbi:diguanylate cyclase (GGDEF)-like protein [Novosphingobium sp. ST904]|nr:diguanylate cyclase (GGDEF)-like protein [Novosphingobium sp. ST904]